MRKKSFLYGLIFFAIFFAINSIADLYTGYISRRNFSFNEPISWEEYFEELPKLIVISLFIAVVSTIIVLRVKKDQVKIEEAARKRRENEEIGKNQLSP